MSSATCKNCVCAAEKNSEMKKSLLLLEGEHARAPAVVPAPAVAPTPSAGDKRVRFAPARHEVSDVDDDVDEEKF